MPRRASADNVLRLTKSSIATLTLDDGQNERVIWDAETRGLGLRIRASGAKVWVIRPPRSGGRSSLFTLGGADILSLAEARAAALDRMASATLGKDVRAEREAAKARAATTFGSVLPRYLAHAERRLRASSFDDTRRHLDVHCKPLHLKPLAEIKRADLANLLYAISTKSGPYASNRVRAALSTYFVWLLGEGLVEANPVIGTNKAAGETARSRVLTAAELASVWQSCDGEGDFARIVRMLILTGQRREEVAALRWSELDLDKGLWTLLADRTKNGRSHTVPLSEPACTVLRSVPMREHRDLVFGQQSGPFSGFSKAKAALDRRLGFPHPWVLHDLRRTVATGMAALGTDLPVIERVLNHVSGSFGGIVGVYQHHDFAKEKRTALDAWATHVLKVVS